jgi:hypothetical protein
MKVTIDIDCTPEEARAFLGLPDVTPLQETMMREIEERMRAALRNTDPEVLFKTWLPASLQGWEQIQAFWRGMAGAAAKPAGKPAAGKAGEGA